MNDFLLKFVMLGDMNVGKSTLIKNYVERVTPTVGVDFVSTNLFLDNKNYKIHIWDTSGNRSFLNLIRIYFKSTIAAILVFDLGNVESFNSIDFWLQQILMESRDYKKLALIGVHKGERRMVTHEMIRDKCQIYDLDYFETGEDFHIEHCFIHLTNKIMKAYKEKPHLFKNLEGFKSSKPVNVTLDYINFDEQIETKEDCYWCKNNCSII